LRRLTTSGETPGLDIAVVKKEGGVREVAMIRASEEITAFFA